MRPVARLAYLLLVLAMLFMVGAFGLLSIIDRDRLVADAAYELGAVLGREVVVDGPATVGLWPLPGIHTGAVTTRSGGLVTAPGSVIVPHPLYILRGEARPWLVVLVRPEIGLDLSAPPTPGPRRSVSSLSHVAALAGTVTLRAGAGGAPARLRRVSLLGSVDAAGRARALSLAGDWRGRAVRLDARAEDAAGLASGDGTQVRLEIATGDDHLAYSGVFGRDRATSHITADGHAELRLADPREIAELLDLALPAGVWGLSGIEGRLEARILPGDLRLSLNTAAALGGHALSLQARVLGGPGWREQGPGTVEITSRAGALYSAYAGGGFAARDRFEGTLTASALDLPAIQDWLGLEPGARPVAAARATIRAAMTAGRNGIDLTEMTFTLDGQPVTGTLGLLLGARRTLTGALVVPVLDLGRMGGRLHQRLRRVLTALEETGTGLSLTVETKRLVNGDLPLGEMRAGLTHRDGVAEAEVGRLGAFSGLLTGRLRMPTRGPAALEATFAFAEVDAASLAGAAGLAILTGTAAGDARIAVPDLDAPGAGRLTASAKISVYDGALALPLGAGGAAPFRRLDAVIDLAEGHLNVRDLALSAAGGGYRGAFAVTLADRALAGALSPGGDPAADNRLELSGTVDAPVLRRIALSPQPDPPPPSAPAPPDTDAAGAESPTEPAPAPDAAAGAGAANGPAARPGEDPAAETGNATAAPEAEAPQDATGTAAGRVPVPAPARR